MLKYLNQFKTIENYVKKYGVHNLNTTSTFRCPSGFGPHKIWIPRSKSASGYGPPPFKSAKGYGPSLRGFGPPPTKLSESIILNVLVKMDDTLLYVPVRTKVCF